MKISPVIRNEIMRRAALLRRETRMVVDYYRIRQKLLFPLPVEEFPEHLSTVRGLPNYPYATWLLWQLEERIFTLGWAAEWDGESSAVRKDLEALAGWTRFRFGPLPDLCSAHITRILTGSLRWKWVPTGLRKKICSTMRRVVDDGFPHLPTLAAETARELICEGIRFPNIPTIGALGLAIAATRVRHPLAAKATARARLMAELWLEWGERGHVEGVSYDGYTCDFLMDWLFVCPSTPRKALLSHPRLQKVLQEIQYLGAPGRPENLAPLGDVEPFAMRFHYSFAAKYFSQCGSDPSFTFPDHPEKFLRCEALPYLSQSRQQASRLPAVCDAYYALVLQSTPSLKVAVSWSNSEMGHMQPDHGSLVLGAGGEWLIDDPGYRQYLPTSEQKFTLSSYAHNHPVINGDSPSQPPVDRGGGISENRRGWIATSRREGTTVGGKAASLERCRDAPDCGYERIGSPSEAGIRLNLGPTYARWQGSCFREIRVDRQNRVVVEDRMEGSPIRRLDYHWHGCSLAAWRVFDGCASLLACKNTLLQITCEGYPLLPSEIHRLPGSRGQLSLVKTLRFAKPRKKLLIRWLFEPRKISYLGLPQSA